VYIIAYKDQGLRQWVIIGRTHRSDQCQVSHETIVHYARVRGTWYHTEALQRCFCIRALHARIFSRLIFSVAASAWTQWQIYNIQSSMRRQQQLDVVTCRPAMAKAALLPSGRTRKLSSLQPQHRRYSLAAIAPSCLLTISDSEDSNMATSKASSEKLSSCIGSATTSRM